MVNSGFSTQIWHLSPAPCGAGAGRQGLGSLLHCLAPWRAWNTEHIWAIEHTPQVTTRQALRRGAGPECTLLLLWNKTQALHRPSPLAQKGEEGHPGQGSGQEKSRHLKSLGN